MLTHLTSYIVSSGDNTGYATGTAVNSRYTYGLGGLQTEIDAHFNVSNHLMARPIQPTEPLSDTCSLPATEIMILWQVDNCPLCSRLHPSLTDLQLDIEHRSVSIKLKCSLHYGAPLWLQTDNRQQHL